MKNNLRILALCLVGMFAVNCSSDDNSITEPGKEEVDPGKEEYKSIVLVLSSEENVFNVEDNKETLESTNIVKFNYNEQYLLTSTTLSIPFGNTNAGDNIGDTKYIYNDKLQLTSLEYKGQIQYQFFYENNLLIKSIEDDITTNNITEYKYDSSNKVIEIIGYNQDKNSTTPIANKSYTKYKYNSDELITHVIDSENDKYSAEITYYDKGKTLFENSIHNPQLGNSEYLYELELIYNPKKNIHSITDLYSQYISTYEFNEEGYPIKETTIEKDLKTGSIETKTVTTYTYKIVKVKK
ncbi:hypothetical protein [Myroides profundi]|uniref:DUF4595 domain-containing protein n=1 Tax=Myroides profundi TaxID=480520 RepID=A0AAJ5BDI1_MYRPR|nr:hypothetical protein [Myroides profundi]AJH16303.1 hypothetical protein MPR_3177 [Myroides profundi]SEQ60384.1 hypothetical protein SAMN04488089_104178 [Myroides profundi]